MTEGEWLGGIDPEKLIRFLRGRASDRKLRLFACACCRRVWHLLNDEDIRQAVEVAERYADGEVSWLDGVSVDYDDWHFNVRPSNTEPLLRLNLESLVSREDMEAKRDEVLDLIRS